MTSLSKLPASGKPSRRGVPVEVAKSATLDFKMELGTVETSVVVAAASEFSLQTLDSSLVVSDPRTIRDRAEVFNPGQYTEGIDFVFENGVPVIDSGKPTRATPGEVLTLPQNSWRTMGSLR